MGVDPFGVLGRPRNALGEHPMRRFGREIGVRSGLLVEQMLLVAQALAGRAIEDPVLLPFVEMLEALEQQDDPRGDDPPRDRTEKLRRRWG